VNTNIASLIHKIRELPQITSTTPTVRMLLEEIVAALKEWQLEREARPVEFRAKGSTL
jgi:hypothetical protein